MMDNDDNNMDDDTNTMDDNHKCVVLFYKYFIPFEKYKQFYKYCGGGSKNNQNDNDNNDKTNIESIAVVGKDNTNNNNHDVDQKITSINNNTNNNNTKLQLENEQLQQQPVSSTNTNIMILLKEYIENLCYHYQLKGRILIAEEGINGTLSSFTLDIMNEFIYSMKQFDVNTIISQQHNDNNNHNVNNKDNDNGKNHNNESLVTNNDAEYLFEDIDWKISTVIDDDDNNISSKCEPFPDMKVTIVKEIISTGGMISTNDMIEYGCGIHLNSTEFHNTIKQYPNAILIDVRNTFEYNIGHFINPNTTQSAINPNTVQYSTFSTKFCKSLKQQQESLSLSLQEKEKVEQNDNVEEKKDKDDDINNNKQLHEHERHVHEQQPILMYCTGGIRCEKASVMLKKSGINNPIYQLNGGIHRYLEQYGNDGYFHGKNFVFDQRIIQKIDDNNNELKINSSTNSSNMNNNDRIIGKCLECRDMYDELCGSRICTICRDLVLICNQCQKTLREYHCSRHQPFKDCYYTFLEIYTIDQLMNQCEQLNHLHNTIYSIGNEYKHIRKTITKQINKIHQRIHDIQSHHVYVNSNALRRCRTCMETNDICNGKCWGFWKTTTSTPQPSALTNDDDSIINSLPSSSSLQIPNISIGDRVRPGPNWNEFKLGTQYIDSSTMHTVGSGAATTTISDCDISSSSYRSGTVVDIKSWGIQNGYDVAVDWDINNNENDDNNNLDDSNDNEYNDSDNNSNHKQCHNAKMTKKNKNSSSTILVCKYRWGIIASNGERMYDLKKVI